VDKIPRILVISAFLPYPPTNGFNMRVSALLQALRKQGASVKLLCFGTDSDFNWIAETSSSDWIEVIDHPIASISQAKDYMGRLGTLPSRMPHAVARFRSEQMRRRISERVKAERFDVIICETPYMFVNIPKRLDVVRIISSHNIESRLLRRYLRFEKNPVKRCYAAIETRKMTSWERKAFSRCDAALACSDIDAEGIRRMNPDLPTFIVPNTIDSATYIPSDVTDRFTMLYLGGMDWFPNRDAVQHFVSAIFPSIRAAVPNVKFVVAGRNPTAAFRKLFDGVPGMKFTGTLADLRPVMSHAAVVVVPLRIGSGTRFKILEAAAMAKPIVSTRLGAEGLDFEDGEDIVIADDSVTFAQAVIDLLKDRTRCAELGRAARCRVGREYSFAALEESVGQVLDHLRDENIGTAVFGYKATG
jgi:glycosyltransferase involved in cell wall biosynthesis